MDPFIGQIMQVGFIYAPINWLTCNGQILQISQNNALYALLGHRFGGDGRNTFGLPDARGRAFIGTGQGPGLTLRQLGDKGGLEQQVLTPANLPTHTHTSTVGSGTVTVSGGMLAMAGLSAADETAQPTPGAYLGAALEQDTSPVLYVPANTSGTPVPLGGLEVSVHSTPPTVSIQPAGNSAPVSMMPPFQAMTTIIATNGIWPENPD